MRIDVSVALTYTSPPANPFYGAAPGRDEIFARADASNNSQRRWWRRHHCHHWCGLRVDSRKQCRVLHDQQRRKR